jgi:hypothetical protein
MPKELTEFQKEYGTKAFGTDFVENMSKGLCPQCKRPALEHCSTDAGRIDVGIHGLCEECFDKLTEGIGGDQ